MDLIIFCLIIFVFIFIGFKTANKVKDDSSYLLANRKTSLLSLISTLVMTEFNTSTLLAFSALGFSFGLWALNLPFVFLIGLGFYSLSVATKWKRLNGLSVAEVFTIRFGSDMGRIASLFLILAMIGFSATYVKSLLFLFQPFLENWNPYFLSFVLVMIVLFICLRGGLVAIIQTDNISFIFTILLIPLLLFFSMKQENKTFMDLMQSFPPETAEGLPIKFILSLVLITMFTYILAPWYGQKIFAATDSKTAKKAVAISSLLVFILYSFPVLAVAFLRVNGVKDINPETGISLILKSYFPEGLRGFGFAVLFLAATTTLSGVWSAITTMIVGDFLLDKKNKSLGNDYKGSMQLTLLVAFLSWLFANLFVDSILKKLILANIPIFALSYSLLSAFYWKKATRLSAIISTVIGLVWGIFCYLYFGEEGGYTWYWASFGLLLVFGSGILSSILFPRTKEDEERYLKLQDRMLNGKE
jgi:Na+/proline symporter